MVCSCLGAFRHPLGFALQPQGETFRLTDVVMAPSPCPAGEGGEEEEGWAALAPSLRLCRQLCLSLEGSGVTVAFGWVNLGVTCRSAEALPVPGRQAACRQRVQPRLLPGPGGQQPSRRPLKLSKALQRRWGDGNGRILPAGSWGPGWGAVLPRIAASAHFCPSCLRRSCPIAASPSSPLRAAPLPRAPRQRRGGSPRTSRELMLQLMPLVCQLLNPAQAPAEVRLNSGNCTNMVLFLPRAKPCSSCIALGCFLKLPVARSRAGLVQRGQDWHCWLLSLLAAGSPGHHPAQTPVPAAAAGNGCPVLQGLDTAGCGVPPRKGSVGGMLLASRGSGRLGWRVGGSGEKRGTGSVLLLRKAGAVVSGGSRSQGD